MEPRNLLNEASASIKWIIIQWSTQSTICTTHAHLWPLDIRIMTSRHPNPILYAYDDDGYYYDCLVYEEQGLGPECHPLLHHIAVSLLGGGGKDNKSTLNRNFKEETMDTNETHKTKQGERENRKQHSKANTKEGNNKELSKTTKTTNKQHKQNTPKHNNRCRAPNTYNKKL